MTAANAKETGKDKTEHVSGRTKSKTQDTDIMMKSRWDRDGYETMSHSGNN